VLQKFADCQLLDAVSINKKRDFKRFASKSIFSDFDFEPEFGYLYIALRAISNIVNKNADGFSAEELKGMTEYQHPRYGYATFKYKPHFIQHKNSNPLTARGVILDAKIMETPVNKKLDEKLGLKRLGENDVWVKLLVEIDAESFPRYAEAIQKGRINKFSMGCDVEKSICSVCGNVATDVDEFCTHIKHYKGSYIKEGSEEKFVYEDCKGLRFFEISGVYDPADPTAYLIDSYLAPSSEQVDTTKKVAMVYKRTNEGLQKVASADENLKIWW